MMFRCFPVFFLLAVVCCHAEQEAQSKSKVCANVFCGAGRECAVNEKGEPSCLCIEQCKSHKRSVCGSNGKTYRNHCELHRDACLTGLKIQVDHDGHCKEKKQEKAAASPVVCYVADRNELRRRVIDWLQTEVVPDGWFTKGSNFTDILLKYFKNYDSGDSQLDSAELLKFIQHNETAVQMNSYAEEENNRLLRSLCVDALIELSDENADWKLSFDEFLNCLKPGFNPPEKKCALEDETYEDGAETQVECNRCVCACGNWVCTAMTCDEKSPVIDTDGDQEMTEEEWTRRVAELNKHQETVEKMKTSTKEV
ncbi:follistatin-related protein 1b isoform X2 [Carassius auratus]|uniref:Follistatin-related protein 1 n=1 Tax=Carassius auratus TaxID=7957 RepID=A0A6P6Q456_CARAU|nr:follistatin-related protein 1 isoform X2 [Carassius auratus]XP_052421591.1 follistatin-related protein 1b isoform X1 [Carassius gibelio]